MSEQAAPFTLETQKKKKEYILGGSDVRFHEKFRVFVRSLALGEQLPFKEVVQNSLSGSLGHRSAPRKWKNRSSDLSCHCKTGQTAPNGHVCTGAKALIPKVADLRNRGGGSNEAAFRRGPGEIDGR